MVRYGTAYQSLTRLRRKQTVRYTENVAPVITNYKYELERAVVRRNAKKPRFADQDIQY